MAGLNLALHRAEIVRWVSESLRPFLIVEDRGFQSLMKTGRPAYYIPSQWTVSRDVHLVFARTHNHIATMLQVSSSRKYLDSNWTTYQKYDGKMSFTTDAWTSPNHRAFIAFSVHLEHKGVPLSMPLDVVEVAKVCDSHTLCCAWALTIGCQSHTGLEMATAFSKVPEDFGLVTKVVMNGFLPVTTEKTETTCRYWGWHATMLRIMTLWSKSWRHLPRSLLASQAIPGALSILWTLLPSPCFASLTRRM